MPANSATFYWKLCREIIFIKSTQLHEGQIKMNSNDNTKEQLKDLINQVSILYSSKNIAAHYLDYFKRKAKVTKLVDAPEPVKKVLGLFLL